MVASKSSGLLYGWKMLKSILKPSNYNRGSLLQERADLLRLYMLTGARETWPHVEPFPDDPLDLPSYEYQREKALARVLLQANTLLGHWLAERPPPLPPESPRAPISDDQRAVLEAERAEAKLAAQRAAFGFELSVGPSSAGVGAGNGVFLTGSTPPGSVIAFYPGVTYELTDVLMLPGGTRFFQGNGHLMARFDKAIVDASPKALELVSHDGLDNPMSVAHLVNHPPRSAEPNVLPAPIDWYPARVPHELVPLMPNVSYLNSSAKQRAQLESGGANPQSRARDLSDWVRTSLADGLRPPEPELGRPLKGLALIAARPLKDEELFLNYRLNPRNKYPDWYTPYDLEEDTRRWS
jgi:hypothetical protein